MYKTISGVATLPLIELTSKRNGFYVARYGCERDETYNGEGEQYVYWVENFDHKPTLKEVKEAVLNHIDAQTDKKILCGYQWTVLHGDDAGRTVNVWLSAENKENYKAKYDTAKDDPELVSWPQKFKVSENDDLTPVYEYFADFSELKAFYYGGLNHIERTVNEGWALKDGIDWSPYEQALNA